MLNDTMDCQVSLDSVPVTPANTAHVSQTCTGNLSAQLSARHYGWRWGGRVVYKGKLIPDSTLLHLAGSRQTVNITREVSIKTKLNLRVAPVHGQRRLVWLGCRWRLNRGGSERRKELRSFLQEGLAWTGREGKGTKATQLK